MWNSELAVASGEIKIYYKKDLQTDNKTFLPKKTDNKTRERERERSWTETSFS